MKIFQILMTGTVALLLSASCSKSDTNGSSATTASMQFQLTSSNPVIVVNRVEAGSLNWTSGTAYATQTKLEAKQNGSQLEFKSTIAQQVNLFSSVITALGNITLPQNLH